MLVPTYRGEAYLTVSIGVLHMDFCSALRSRVRFIFSREGTKMLVCCYQIPVSVTQYRTSSSFRPFECFILNFRAVNFCFYL